MHSSAFTREPHRLAVIVAPALFALSTSSASALGNPHGGTEQGRPAARCPLPNYPRPGCTGLPSGTVFTRTIEGDYTANRPGQVFNRWHVTGSIIAADNVVIRNNQIDDSVLNDSTGAFHPFTIKDTTVGPADCGQPTAQPNGVGFAEYKAVRVLVRGHEDGFRASGPNVTIRGSYYKAWVTPESHADGVQAFPLAQGVVVAHNTFDMAGLAEGFTSPIFSEETVGARVVNNLVLGGVFSIFVKSAHGTWTVSGNRAVNGTWAFATFATFGLCGSNLRWTDNAVVTISSDYQVTSILRREPCPA
jgi:hypothetical protein